ncbi:GTP pyrophosphokinase [Klebsiella pneumoniae]|uniref:GTP pyrophosphokinase n=1 Tax=Klebsiella pneumoniae complex TaxID=3390273 RepID=UPI0027EB46B9|nr:hypothetical protein [Klebsiella pneumoniae]HDU3638387.1 hypothetical protein [Klebsiella pneumoniae subsp. pneumoniae]HCD6908844.1 hypothetical protein [Klebsiella pneumoniae]HCT2451266.1 hypothetical protein [Klebsiella pneumoniae]HDU3838321.1 hypothetical protein [Klebsiella pneumoniae subsp. pneumoniae]
MTNILSVYDEQKDNFESYALSLKSLLNTLIRDAGVTIHSLDSRVKNRKSLEKKIIDKDKYDDIFDITDVIGIRIITHYSDDVDIIAKLIEQEFIVDSENSIDKRTTLEPDRFGYLSLHYIVSLSNNRTCLREYVPYKDIKAEIQIRSILQHAWAEIEHDIGYKTADGLPNEIRRYFSRLAGLLELADDEFIKIRQAINIRQEEAINEIEHGEGLSPLDIVSLSEFLKKNKTVKEISDNILQQHNLIITDRNENINNQKLLNGLHLIDIYTIKDLDQALNRNKELILKRVNNISETSKALMMRNGMPNTALILYLMQVVIAKENSEELENTFFEIIGSKISGGASSYFENIKKSLYNDQ